MSEMKQIITHIFAIYLVLTCVSNVPSAIGGKLRKLQFLFKLNKNFPEIHKNRIHARNFNLDGSTHPNGLDLFLDKSKNFLAFHNSSSEIGIVFDLTSTRYLVVNGKNWGILVDSQDIYELNTVWESTKENFDTFFEKTKNLNDFKQSGHKIDWEKITQKLDVLTPQLGVENSGKLLEISKDLEEIQKSGNLSGFIKKNKLKTRIKGGITRLVVILSVLEELFGVVPGGVKALSEAGVDIDLFSIINSANGIDALVIVLESIGPHFDLGENFWKTLGSHEVLLKIITQLGGHDRDNGLQNALEIIYTVISVKNHHAGLDKLIKVLIESAQNDGVLISASEVQPLIQRLLKLEKLRHGNSKILGPFIKLLLNLNENNLILNGINMSELLKLLQKSDYRGAVEKIIRVFLQLNNVINPAVALPRVFGHLLGLFNSSRIGNLIPGLNSSGINLDLNRLMQELNGEVLKNISQVPGLGQVFQYMQDSLKNATNGTWHMGDLLNSTAGWQAVWNPVALVKDVTHGFSNTIGG